MKGICLKYCVVEREREKLTCIFNSVYKLAKMNAAVSYV